MTTDEGQACFAYYTWNNGGGFVDDEGNWTLNSAENVEAMVEKRKEVNKITDIRELAVAYHDEVAPYFDAIRYHIDKLELIVEDDMWPLPKYRELLFVR